MDTYKLCFHQHCRKTIERLRENDQWRDELTRCINGLRENPWRRGLKVKQLQGGNNAPVKIYEARINIADRLLFSKFPRGRLTIYNVFEHDEVNRVYRRHPGVPEQGDDEADEVLRILNPPSVDNPELDNVDMDEARHFDSDYVSASTSRIYEPPGKLDTSDALLKWCQSDEIEAELLLSEEQECAKSARSPLLISGSAGGGKSTVIVHRMAKFRAENKEARILYVTYSERLCRKAEGLYNALVSRNGEGHLSEQTLFLNYGELCRRLIQDAGYRASKELFDEKAFLIWAKQQKSAVRLKQRGLTASDIWAELRGVVKGRAEYPGEREAKLSDEAMLSSDHYCHLSDGKGFLPDQYRSDVWGLCREYQNHLSKLKEQHKDPWQDEMDLTWSALLAFDRLAETQPGRWSFHACFADEVQDLSGLQFSLLRKLWCRGTDDASVFHSELVIAGDPHQVIYPSAFRWPDITDFFYEGEEKKETFSEPMLPLNFRCSGRIQALARAVLTEIKKPLVQPTKAHKRVKLSYPEPDLRSSTSGETPIRIYSDEAAFLDKIRSLPHSPERFVLTRTREDADHLKRKITNNGELATEDFIGVLPIEDFKGLEADSIVLWRYFDAEFWRSYRDKTTTDSFYEKLVEVNRLYVALTRARQELIIFDPEGDPSPWDRKIVGKCQLKKQLASDWKPVIVGSTLKQLLQRAEEFEQNGNFEEAASNYIHAGRHDKATDCYELAGQREQGLREWQKASSLWMKTRRNWQKAIYCLNRLEKDDRVKVDIAVCQAELAEERGDWRVSAEEWQHAGNWRRGALAWEKAVEWQRAEQLLIEKHAGQTEVTALRLRRLAHELGCLIKALADNGA